MTMEKVKNSGPWVVSVLICICTYLVKDSYEGMKDELKAVHHEIDNLKVDVASVKTEIHLIENYNIQPK